MPRKMCSSRQPKQCHYCKVKGTQVPRENLFSLAWTQTRKSRKWQLLWPQISTKQWHVSWRWVLTNTLRAGYTKPRGHSVSKASSSPAHSVLSNFLGFLWLPHPIQELCSEALGSRQLVVHLYFRCSGFSIKTHVDDLKVGTSPTPKFPVLPEAVSSECLPVFSVILPWQGTPWFFCILL